MLPLVRRVGYPEPELALEVLLASKSPDAIRLGRQSYMRANDLDYRRNIENQVETMCNVMETAAALPQA